MQYRDTWDSSCEGENIIPHTLGREQKCAFYSSGGEILCARELVDVKYYVLNIYIHAVKPVFILSSNNKRL